MKIKTLFIALFISILMTGCYYDYLIDLLERRGVVPDTMMVIAPHVEDCFIDLTSDDGFTSEYSFNAPKFKAALKNLQPASPAETFAIAKPDFLTNRSPFVATTGWVKTCEFAFEDQDFSRVLNAVTSAAAAYSDIEKSYHSESLAWFEPVSGYSKDGEYWLVPIFLDNGKIWLKVDRKRNEDRGGYKDYSYYYTATAYWMTGYEKETDGDVS